MVSWLDVIVSWHARPTCNYAALQPFQVFILLSGLLDLSCMDMHSSTSVTTCTVSTLMSKSLITSSLFSLWLCQDSQSVI